MATILTPSGAEFQINVNSGGNNGISGAQDLANLAVLTDGRFVVTYQSDYFGTATDTDPIVAIFNPGGTTSFAYGDVHNAGGLQKAPAVAERLNGGLGVVFQNERHANNTVDANGPNITYVPVTGTGGVLSPIAVADFNAGAGHDALQNPAIATLSSGRQVVVFERIWTALTDHDVFLNVVNAAGTATQFSIANPLDVSSNASWQANPSVATIGNSALVVFEDGSTTTTASANIRVRLFDGDTNTLGAAFTIADHAARLRTADVAAIDDHRYAIVYGDQNDIWAKIYDATTGTLSPEVQADAVGGFALDPAIARLPGDRFVVTWAEFNGADYDVRARLFDSAGAAMGSNFLVTSLTDASQFTADVAVSGSHVLFSWTDFGARPEDAAPTGIRGRIFDAGTVSETPHWIASVDVGPHPAGWAPSGIGDFNNDGSSDLAWYNPTTRNIDIWKLADGEWIGSTDVGTHPAGYQPAGFGDFDRDGTTDIAWHNPTTNNLDIWKIANGGWAGSVDVGSHPAGWQPALTGDFDGDGTSDIAWYNPTTNNLDIWKIANGGWAGSVDVGSHPAGYQPALAGDFTGDGTSDILWYNPTTGDVDIWKLSNAGWAGSTHVGLHPAGWQPLGVGDFNLDGTSDIVWYNPTTNNIDVWVIKNGLWAGSFDVGSHPAGSVAVGVGDFDHNDVSDIMWREVSTNRVENWLLTSS
jgi:hypothetical protein